MIVKLTNENFEQEVMQAEGTVVVDFYATWCGPCQMQAPIIDELAEERTDIKFCKLDIDEAVAAALENKVLSVPTIMIVKNGEVVYKQPGLLYKYEFEELLG